MIFENKKKNFLLEFLPCKKFYVGRHLYVFPGNWVEGNVVFKRKTNYVNIFCVYFFLIFWEAKKKRNFLLELVIKKFCSHWAPLLPGKLGRGNCSF